MMNKRGTGEEYPLIVVAEIVLAIFISWLFVDTAKSYASQEIYHKQEIAKEIGLAIDALASIKGNAYVEFNDFYNYIIDIDNTKVEVSSKTKDFNSGVYYFVNLKGNDINPKRLNLNNPVYFAINKQGKNVFVDETTYDSDKIECNKDDKFLKIKESILLYLAAKKGSEELKELEKISEGLKGSIKYELYNPSESVKNRFLLILNLNNINTDSNHIKAYVVHNTKNSQEALSVSCFIINEMIDRVYADSYTIVPIDINRLGSNDPRNLLKDKDFAIYLELGNIGSKSYHKIPSDIAVSFIKGLEEYNK